MTEWNSSDPEAAKVFYDLAEWDFEQQAELAAGLADAEIPHGWNESELVVPEEFEEATDAVFADVEQRLGILGIGTGESPGEGNGVDMIDRDEVESDVAPRQRAIADGVTVTEYDLADWEPLERTLVADSLVSAGIAFRWEDAVLLVPTTDESAVDDILDDVESGNVIPVINDGPEGDEVPFETLNNFFLAGERLRKDTRDADGLERLLQALQDANPNRPPRGVELGVWRRTCELAEELADALVASEDGGAQVDDVVGEPLTLQDSGNDGDDGDGDDGDGDGDGDDDDDDEDDGDDVAADPAARAARDLHDLLRPLI